VIRRICVAGAAVLCPLAFLAGPAGAAKSKTKSTANQGPKIVCSTRTSIMVPSGDTGVLPPAQQGSEYGTASCAKPLGGGVQKDVFTVPASGDTVAKYTMYFSTGTLFGTYDLTPTGEPTSFLETDWTGTMKVTGGTGAFKGAKGVGTMSCKTMDGIHSTCTDKLHVKGA
jgi:hypothetical protein